MADLKSGVLYTRAVSQCLTNTLAAYCECKPLRESIVSDPEAMPRWVEQMIALEAIPIAMKHHLSPSLVTFYACERVREQSESGRVTIDALKNASAALWLELAKGKGGGDGK